MFLKTYDMELIGECPEENAEKVADRLSFLMTNCVPNIKVNFKCDAEIEKHWYDNEYEASIKKEAKELREKGCSESDVLDKICEQHMESKREDLIKYIGE